MNKAKEISALWSEIKPQIGKLVSLCHEVEDHVEVTADAYQRGYEAGLNDAWEAVRKIYSFDLEEREELFHDSKGLNIGSICEAYSASEAIEKIRQYEQEKRFCVGDEFENETGRRFVILKMDGTEIDRYIDEEGKTYCMIAKYKVMRKTGRHFPEIAEVLRKMKETE